MEAITQTLRHAGYRLTNPRRLIIENLTTCPQTVAEIQANLEESHANIDRVTVYRTLDCLVQLGAVEKAQFSDSTTRYNLVSESDHHHHLICNECGSVEDIFVDETFINSAEKQTDFHITNHQLEFFGLCTNCQ